MRGVCAPFTSRELGPSHLGGGCTTTHRMPPCMYMYGIYGWNELRAALMLDHPRCVVALARPYLAFCVSPIPCETYGASSCLTWWHWGAHE